MNLSHLTSISPLTHLHGWQQEFSDILPEGFLTKHLTKLFKLYMLSSQKIRGVGFWGKMLCAETNTVHISSIFHTEGYRLKKN